MLVEAVLFLFVFALSWHFINRPPANYPPTPPIRLPFLGHIHYLLPYGLKNANVGLNALYKKYNKDGVFAFHLGIIKLVLVGDFKLVAEAFKKEETNIRFPDPGYIAIQKNMRGGPIGTEGIINAYGQHWREQRRFMLTTLRDFGFGKSSMEDMINEEVEIFTGHLAEQMKNKVSIQNFFNIAILNILWRIVAGQRFEYSNPKLQRIVAVVSELATAGMKPNIAIIIPALRKLLPASDIINQQAQRFNAIKEFLQVSIDDHKKNFDSENINDFIDAFLAEVKKTSDTTSSFHSSVADDQLMQSLVDLFLAGSETTSSTLAFGILYMIRKPEIQEKARKEIHEVVGTDHAPKLSDREHLPYTNATVMEIQRLGNIIPRGLPHSTFHGEVQVGPFTVPKGHIINALFENVMSSEEYWKNGTEFNPDRFINAKGELEKDEKVIPFSIGKRICPGETLARAEIFLFLAGLLQKFRFEPEEANNPPPLKVRVGATQSPEPFGAKIVQL